MQAACRIGVQAIPVLFEVSDQLGAMSVPRSGIAQRIQLLRDIAQAKFAPQPRAQQNLLGINIRPGKAQRLHTKSMELAVAPLLRAFMAEHRPHVP